MMEIAAAFIAGVLISSAIAYLYRLSVRVQEIEQRAGKVRRTNSDLDNFDDIMAVAVRTLIEEEMQSEVRKARINQLQKMLASMRNLEGDK
jgi:hypothetical protein